MKKFFTFCIILFFILLCGNHASLLFAGQVTLLISTTTGISDGVVKADFKITNQGTEPAGQVSVLGKFRNMQRSVYIADYINPRQSAQSSISFELSESIDGSFPLYVTASYQHANGITASSGSVARVNTGVQTENKLTILATIDDQPNSGIITVNLEADDPEVDRVTVTPHAPEALLIEPPLQEITLQQSKGGTKFKVINISGNEGDTYGVFFTAEYETGGIRNLATAQISVPVADILPHLAPDAETLKARLSLPPPAS